jgi:hypothetical protein
MRRLAPVTVVVSVLSWNLSAQEPDRSLERVRVGLQHPAGALRDGDPHEALRVSTRQTVGVPIFEPLSGAPKLGPFTLGTTDRRGEIIRLSLPIGEFASGAARALAAANRRRQETAARRSVEADLKAFAERQPPTRE